MFEPDSPLIELVNKITDILILNLLTLPGYLSCFLVRPVFRKIEEKTAPDPESASVGFTVSHHCK